MSKKRKDTDYLYISTRIRSLENKLLTQERMERMLEARTTEEAAKILAECGYEGLEPITSANLEKSLALAREGTFHELAEASPNPQIVDVFRVKYDYHNAKAVLKAIATNQEAGHLLIDAGRIPASQLEAALRQGELAPLPEQLRQAVAAASQELAATGDPQKCDFYLDRSYYEEMTALAEASRSKFLQGYVRLMIDTANLKATVRSMRMAKGEKLLRTVLVVGGNISPDVILAECEKNAPLDELFSGVLQEAAKFGTVTAKGGRQTAFEKACDNALNHYLQESRMIPFGDAVLVAYAAARENEITAARIILSGRLAGVPTESIRERLRDAYV